MGARSNWRTLTALELAELRRYRDRCISQWKMKLRLAWKGKPGNGDPEAHKVLMDMRDSHGLTWLSYFNDRDEVARQEVALEMPSARLPQKRRAGPVISAIRRFA